MKTIWGMKIKKAVHKFVPTKICKIKNVQLNASTQSNLPKKEFIEINLNSNIKIINALEHIFLRDYL